MWIKLGPPLTARGVQQDLWNETEQVMVTVSGLSRQRVEKVTKMILQKALLPEDKRTFRKCG